MRWLLGLRHRSLWGFRPWRFRTHLLIWLVAIELVLLWALHGVGGTPDPVTGASGPLLNGTFPYLILFGPVAVVIALGCAASALAGWRGMGFVMDNASIATRPIPSPPEIAWQLQQEWGRQPTVEEVAAVQQLLMNERNQALVNAGMSLGAHYIMSNIAHK